MNDTANPEARKPEAGTPVSRRRTFAIISHPDAGKTTLTEKLLLFGGAIQLAGEVKAKKNRIQTRSDWMEIERERGISVVTSVMTFEYGDCVFNLLDTPGHEDFSEDTYRTLTAVDSAVMVIDAAKGIEPRTLKLFEVCRLRDIPIVTFVNKMDRESARPVRAPRRDREEAGARHRARSPGRSAGAGPSPAPTIWRATRCAGSTQDEARRRSTGPIPTRAGLLPEHEREAFIEETRAGAGGLPAVRPRGLPRGPSDAGLLRLGAAQFRRARPDRRARRLRPAAARRRRPTRAWSRPTEAEHDRLRVQDPGEHGPQPPRPHRLRARLLGQARRAA